MVEIARRRLAILMLACPFPLHFVQVSPAPFCVRRLSILREILPVPPQRQRRIEPFPLQPSHTPDFSGLSKCGMVPEPLQMMQELPVSALIKLVASANRAMMRAQALNLFPAVFLMYRGDSDNTSSLACLLAIAIAPFERDDLSVNIAVPNGYFLPIVLNAVMTSSRDIEAGAVPRISSLICMLCGRINRKTESKSIMCSLGFRVETGDHRPAE